MPPIMIASQKRFATFESKGACANSFRCDSFIIRLVTVPQKILLDRQLNIVFTTDIAVA